MHLERWRDVSVALAIAALASIPAAARDRECAIETRLQWVDVMALAPFAYPVVASETAQILAEHGVCADVARASPKSVRGRGEIGVILLRTMGGSGVGRHVLGATRSRDARNATVWVYFDEIAQALGLGGRGTESWSQAERVAFGRALGRVAAHEVVHTLLPDRPHDTAGLMAPSLGREALTATALSAHPSLRDAVRQRSWASAK
jgi:hypothetical protein